MAITVYAPACTITLYKLVQRTDGVASRYSAARLDLDLTPYLGDAGSWRTAKGVTEAVGGFSISFADQADSAIGDTVYAEVEPMDMIEIRASRTPWKFAGGKLPLIMRGLVSTVRRSNSMSSDGSPINSVVIQGQDFGKLWQIQQVLYEVGYAVENFFLTEFKLLPATGMQSLLLPVADYMQQLTAAMNDKVKQLAVYSSHQVPPFVCDASVPDGQALLSSLSNYEGPYWGLAEIFADRPWNELFIQDQEDGPHLVHRPCPFKDVDGNYIVNGAKDPGSFIIDQSEIVSLNVERSDANVANFYAVDMGSSSLEAFASLNVLSVRNGLALDFNHGNNSPELFGYKKIKAHTRLVDTGMQVVPNTVPAGPDRSQAISTYPAWYSNRMLFLRYMNRDNGVFEEGDAQVMGSENHQAGQYALIQRGALTSEYYVSRVDHSFQPMQTWTTSLALTRGTGFLDRNKAAGSPMWLEKRPGPYST